MICRIAGLGRPAWVARRGAGVGPVGPPKNGKRSRVAGQGEKPGKGFQFLQVDKYLCCKVLPNSINLPNSGSPGKSPGEGLGLGDPETQEWSMVGECKGEQQEEK